MKPFILLPIVFIGILNVYAQNSKDAVLWSSLGIEKKINERINAELEQQFRFIENYSYLNNAFTELSVSYKLTKEFKLAGSYRLSNRFNERVGHYMRNRYSIDASYRYKIKKMAFTFRTRFQNTSDNRGDRENAIYSRNKIAFAYSVNNYINPSIYADFYSPLNLGSDAAGIIDRYRLGISNELKASKKISVSSAFIFQKSVGVSNPPKDYIVSIGLYYKL
ncbi:hypothetical protein FLAV_01241 [Flavobacteriales bacterium]|nr:hypothetical protein FLAV_01241 [Flavobacteriales bacterium]